MSLQSQLSSAQTLGTSITRFHKATPYVKRSTDKMKMHVYVTYKLYVVYICMGVHMGLPIYIYIHEYTYYMCIYIIYIHM